VVAADVVWLAALIEPLVQAMAHIARRAHDAWLLERGTIDTVVVRPGDASEPPNPWTASADGALLPTVHDATGAPVFLLAHQTRSYAADRLLMAELDRAGFTVHHVPRERHHPLYQHADIAIMQLVWHYSDERR